MALGIKKTIVVFEGRQELHTALKSVVETEESMRNWLIKNKKIWKSNIADYLIREIPCDLKSLSSFIKETSAVKKSAYGFYHIKDVEKESIFVFSFITTE